VPILVACDCGHRHQTDDRNAGRRARCQVCGRVLIVPKPSAPFDPDFGPDLDDVAALERVSSRKAVASMVLGLWSLVCGMLTGLPAVILGGASLREIKRSEGRLGGRGMAVTGIVSGLIGCAIITLAFLAVPRGRREAIDRDRCAGNLKQIGMAMHNFHDANRHFPPPAIADANGKPLLSWRVAILPYIGREDLFQRFKRDEPWDSAHNLSLLDEMPSHYACPRTRRNKPGTTVYQVVVGPGAVFEENKGASLREITDGAASTFLVVESPLAVPWTKPDDLVFDPKQPPPSFRNGHGGRSNALFADGSVKFLRPALDPATIRACITRNGGEPIAKPF
jgi:prepilin-type processing-associated H-X9-DG protein